MTIASTREFTDAVLTALADAGLVVGDAVKPAGPPPYVIVWPQTSGITSGPPADTHADEDMVIQVTAVGTTREQAQWAADVTKANLLAGELTIPGRTLAGPPQLDVAPGVSRDDDTAGPPLFYAPLMFRFATTPA